MSLTTDKTKITAVQLTGDCDQVIPTRTIEPLGNIAPLCMYLTMKLFVPRY